MTNYREEQLTVSAAVKKFSAKYPLRRAFITGAASGLGFAFAKQLAEDGWTIGVTDVNQHALDEATSQFQQMGAKALPYVFDVSNYDAFKLAVQEFVGCCDGIDIGINNAGIGCGGLLNEVSIDIFRKVIDINVMGVVNGCHLFAPFMQKAKGGHILNVASAAAFVSAPQMTAYNTSKAAVVALSETLRGELADDGVLVSVLMPTYVRTNIGRDAVGAPIARQRAQALVDLSNISPDECVSETFQKMIKEELYVVLPDEARFLWRFKRYLPNQFWRFIHKEVKRRLGLAENAAMKS